MTEILKVTGITKTYHQRKAVDNLTFSIKRGEIVGLVGPNGAGKTTLMRMIMGLVPNYQGEIVLHTAHKKKQGKQKMIGCVIESPSFYPSLTGLDNLKYFAEISGGYDKNDVNHIINLLGLQKAVHKKVKHYSLGMRQRLGIAQALLNNPEFLILDEPTNGLDPSGVYETRELIKAIVKERNISVLISSHILSEIEAICDRVILIKKGKLIKDLDLRTKNETELSTFIIQSVEVEPLVHVLQGDHSAEILNIGDSLVKVRFPRSQIESLIRSLVHKEVRFHGIFEEKVSLEKQFFEVLGGNEIE
ncbi:ABC transporter ATP-binding protein [Priestia filamentosa]|uniref:ABC transporter ATP-binding protein n=1 Tax=Priestia filamentosa TaxID=1402861 RepID=UPI00398399DA